LIDGRNGPDVVFARSHLQDDTHGIRRQRNVCDRRPGRACRRRHRSPLPKFMSGCVGELLLLLPVGLFRVGNSLAQQRNSPPMTTRTCDNLQIGNSRVGPELPSYNCSIKSELDREYNQRQKRLIRKQIRASSSRTAGLSPT
jgi:hypothetical protein